ncbi:hypothetical protein DLM45_02380 [Hyphomicrobium methylovorum]|nr:hypothetical protein [Hyphomicrobium methylovorum]
MTTPQKEFAAEMVLRRRGHDVFVPVETKIRRSRSRERKRIAVTYPMMRSYVFVGFEGEPPWYDLARLAVIQGVVGFDGKPAPISEAAIAKLKSLTGQSIPHGRSVNTHKALRPGDMAEITHGAFFGRIVKVVGLRGRKATIMMELFGGATEVATILLESLEAA